MLGSSKLVTLVAAILSLCLMAMLLCQGVQKAQAEQTDVLDLSENCSVRKVDVAGNVEELNNLCYKLYRVANLKQQPGYDAYQFEPIAGSGARFPGLSQQITDLNKLTTQNSSSSAADEYKALAQSVAAEIAKPGSVIIPEYEGSANTPSINFIPGLFLLVAYGSDAVEDPAGNVLVQQDNGQYASVAFSSTSKFVFAPELIVVPTRVQDSRDPNNTAINSAWNYSPVITLKPNITQRTGALVINKKLDEFAQSDEGDENLLDKESTFIFQVTGYESETAYNQGAESIYSDVVSITFTNGGAKAETLDGLPMGSYVVVEEVYAGTSYEPVNKVFEGIVNANDNEFQNPASPVLTFEFENTYNRTNNRGGSITNKFDYSTSDQNSRTSGGWNWTPVPDNGAGQSQGGDN